jgi:hypothetical protein
MRCSRESEEVGSLQTPHVLQPMLLEDRRSAPCARHIGSLVQVGGFAGRRTTWPVSGGTAGSRSSRRPGRIGLVDVRYKEVTVQRMLSRYKKEKAPCLSNAKEGVAATSSLWRLPLIFWRLVEMCFPTTVSLQRCKGVSQADSADEDSQSAHVSLIAWAGGSGEA